MSHCIGREAASVLAEPRTFSLRSCVGGFAGTLMTWLKRHHDRRELLDYLNTDHRAALDIGADGNRAREWAQRPFWRE